MDLLQKVFKAVANEKRLKMLALLLKNREMELKDIYTNLKIPQATASRNLKILEKNRFLSSRYERGRVFYSLIESDEFPYNKAVLNSIKKRKRETMS
jgi:ArsR family transcriptional regulator